MVLISNKNLVDVAYANHFAIGAFNVGNGQFVKNILTVAENLQAPVILQIYPLEYELMGSLMMTYIHEAAEAATVPVAVHLDHGRDMHDVARAIQDRANSVMIDVSGLSFEDNMRQTKAVVELAHQVGVAVEAELGSIGNRNASADDNMGRIYTDPEDAAKFVQGTGIDDLAVAIGTVHGPYPGGENDIKIDILKAINERVKLPLVLHGGSDNPDTKIQEAIANGIAKVNISTDIKLPYVHAIAQSVKDYPKGYEPWQMLTAANQVQQDVVAEKIKLFGSDGKAPLYYQQLNKMTALFETHDFV